MKAQISTPKTNSICLAERELSHSSDVNNLSPFRGQNHQALMQENYISPGVLGTTSPMTLANVSFSGLWA